MTEAVKRKPGRPRKNPDQNAPTQPPKTYKLKAKPNWDSMESNDDVSVDRLRLPASFLEKYSDLSFQWVTNSVFGQEDPQHRGIFEKGGWTPVHQSDFDGELNGLFMKVGDESEINVGGQVLMVRPKELTDKARMIDRRAALEQVSIKEQALRGGDLPVSLDARHPTAVNSNRISKSIERIEIPDK